MSSRSSRHSVNRNQGSNHADADADGYMHVDGAPNDGGYANVVPALEDEQAEAKAQIISKYFLHSRADANERMPTPRFEAVDRLQFQQLLDFIKDSPKLHMERMSEVIDHLNKMGPQWLNVAAHNPEKGLSRFETLKALVQFQLKLPTIPENRNPQQAFNIILTQAEQEAKSKYDSAVQSKRQGTPRVGGHRRYNGNPQENFQNPNL